MKSMSIKVNQTIEVHKCRKCNSCEGIRFVNVPDNEYQLFCHTCGLSTSRFIHFQKVVDQWNIMNEPVKY
jgi:transcription elongation factor Elf1